MAQTIKLRRSASQGAIPTVSQLSLGEIAINTHDGILYIKKDDGTESIVTLGAGSSDTAAELLTKIKTVDGTGTGLDADLLDGQQGSYYAAADSYLPLAGGTITGTTTFTDSMELAYSGGIETFNLFCNNTGFQTLNIASNDLDAGVDKYIYIGKNTGSNAGNTTTIELGDNAPGSLVKAFGNFQASGTVTATGGNSTNWNTAYGWGNHASGGYATQYQYFGTGSGDHDTHHWNKTHAAYSNNEASPTYIVLTTNVPQNNYSMGGFTLVFQNYYNDNDEGDTVKIYGYWNPESNGGFVGFRYHSSNPECHPTIQVGRNSSGKTVFLISGESSNYAQVIAKDFWTGYSATAASSSWGDSWAFSEASATTGISNLNTLTRVGITATQVSNWNTAYGWGDHSTEGYLTSYTDTNTTYSAGTGITLTGTTFSLTDTNAKLSLAGGTMTGKISMFQNNEILGLSGTIANYPRLSFNSSEGTHSAKTQTLAGDLIGQIDFNPYTGTSYTGGGRISFISTEVITSSERGTEARIYSTKTGQSSLSYHQFKDDELYIKNVGGATHKYWHAGNDGDGSGLDADKLDGLQASSFLRSDANDSTTGTITYTPNDGVFLRTGGGGSSDTTLWRCNANATTNDDANHGFTVKYMGTRSGNENCFSIFSDNQTASTQIEAFQIKQDGELLNAGNKIWTAGNDGSGSGLDADLLDGQHGSHYLNYNNLTNKPSIPSLSGYATETYVGNQITALVDSSPATLDTLNELAAALGDDPNFATTVTNSIATKLPLTGGTLTGALTGTTAAFDSIYLNSNDRIYGGTSYRAIEASPTGTQLQLGEGYGLINMFKTQNASNELKLWNNRQDLSNVEVSKVSGYNGGEVANMKFYRGGGGSSGFIRFQNKPTNAAALTDVFQVGDGGTVGYGVDILAGGLRVAGTTVIDSSRNLTNVNLVRFREHNASFYISPTDTNTLNAQYGSAADTADMWINYRGYQDGFTQFRDFRIGNGKGNALLFVDGSARAFDFQSGSFIQMGGTTVIDSSRNLTNIGDITSSGRVNHTLSSSQKLGVGGEAHTRVHVDGSSSAGVFFTVGGANGGTIRSGAANNLQFYTADLAATIDSAGRVGIGTSNPLDLLHINSASGDARQVIDAHTGFDAELKYAVNGTVKYTTGYDAATDSFVIGTSNVDTGKRVVINNAGKVLVNGAHDNGGKADFAVDGGMQIALYDGQVQAGGTDMNWNSKFFYDGHTKLGGWDNDVHLFSQAGSTGTAKSIIFSPQAAGGASTETMRVIGGLGATIGDLSVANTKLQINQSGVASGIHIARNDQTSTNFATTRNRIIFGDEIIGSGIRHQASVTAVREAWSNSPTALTFETSATVNAATEKLRITSAGNVGIGTTTPDGKLDVEKVMQNATTAFSSPHLKLSAQNTTDNTGFVGMTFATSSSNNYGYSYGARRTSNGQGDLIWRFHSNSAGGTEIMRLSQEGHLGLGGITDPLKPLHVESGGTSKGIYMTIGAGARNHLYADGTWNYYKGLSGNGHKFTTTGGANVVVTNAGNVGIGTTSPSEKLQVDGNIRIGDTATGNNDDEEYSITSGGQLIISANDSAADISYSGLILNAGKAGGAAASSSLVMIKTNDTERMRIDSAGTVQFKGGTTDNAIQIWENNSEIARIGGSSGKLNFLVGSTTTPRITIDSSGNVGIGTSSPTELLTVAGNSQTATPTVLISDTDTSVQLNQVVGKFAVSVNDNSAPGTDVKTSIQTVALNSLGGHYGMTFHTTNNDGNDTERMRINQSGLVGIGFSATPKAALQIAKGIVASAPAAGASTGAVCFGNDTSANAYGLVMGADGSGKGYISAQRTDGTASTYDLAVQPNGGNVGIGTSSPNFIFHAKSTSPKIAAGSTIAMEATNDTELGGFVFNTHYNLQERTGMYAVGNYSTSAYQPDLTFKTNSTRRLTILGNGNVGIGTNAPSEKLEVAGSIKVDSNFTLTADSSTLTTTTSTVIASFSATTYGAAKLIITVKDGSNRHMCELLVTHNGTTAIATQYGSIYTSSELATFEVDISGGNVRLLAVSSSTNSTVYRVAQTLMEA